MKIFKGLMLMFSALILLISSCDKCEETKWYRDADGDGFGDPAVSQDACDQPEGYVANGDDIDDSNANVNPNTVWSGAKITFTKLDDADFMLEENQDRITENVWITRGNNKGIYNIKTETVYEDFVSPEDTEWAFGTLSNISNLEFDPWEVITNSTPPDMVGEDAVMHLITDNIYIQVKFLSWAQGGSGGMGGFSYERTTK